MLSVRIDLSLELEKVFLCLETCSADFSVTKMRHGSVVAVCARVIPAKSRMAIVFVFSSRNQAGRWPESSLQ